MRSRRGGLLIRFLSLALFICSILMPLNSSRVSREQSFSGTASLFSGLQEHQLPEAIRQEPAVAGTFAALIPGSPLLMRSLADICQRMLLRGWRFPGLLSVTFRVCMMLTAVLGIAATTSHSYIISFIRTLPEDAGNLFCGL